MPTRPTPRSFQPTLETLEGREMPSGLLAALQSLNNDLNSANSSFQADQALLVSLQTSPPPSLSQAEIGSQYDKATVDYQRMLSDQSAIQKTGAADIAFLNLAAGATGNSELIALTLLVVDPQFQKVINQANTTVSNVSSQVNQSYTFPVAPFALPPIASRVSTT